MRNLRRYITLIVRLARVYLSHMPRKDIEYRRIIFYTFREWGGVYIKFLQILASNSKFLNGWGGPQEMQMFAQAPREKIQLDDYININNFRVISSQPIAAGSFALVFRGELKSGEDVAVKILRPSIQQNLKSDLRALRRLCRLFSCLLPRTIIDYNEAYEACAKMFLLETDYQREMANQEFFAELYKDHPRMVIPKVYRELSTSNVIVQDFVAGPTLADVMSTATSEKSAKTLTLELTGSDLWEQVVVAGGEALYTAMCADYVYGDPHPGNIILLPENRIALIDFGIIADRPSSHRAFYKWVKSYYDILMNKGQFRDLLEATVVCFCPDIAIAMQRCNFGNSDLLTVLTEAVEEKLNNEMAFGNMSYIDSFREGHLADVFIKVAGTNVLDVKVDKVNFELIKAMQAFLGSVTILDNSEGEHGFAQIMKRSMEYALASAEHRGIPYDDIYMTRLSMTDSYELLIKTVSAIADTDEYMFSLVQERIFA